MSDALDRRIRARLEALARRGQARALPAITERRGASYKLDGIQVLGLCSNDYLGLGTRNLSSSLAVAPPPDPPHAPSPPAEDAHLPLHQASAQMIPPDGSRRAIPRGATASRLVAGDLECHREAEAALAQLLDTPDCVLFPSGYQANVAALSAVLERGQSVFCDELMHASLIDGVRLARAVPRILPHLHAPTQIDAIRQGVDETQRAHATVDALSGPRPTVDDATGHVPRHVPGHVTNDPLQEPPWWICESIYSMDGDQTDPSDARAYLQGGNLLYVDEAHSIGMYPGGRGWSAQHQLRPTILCAPLGKAFGLAGAAVGCSAVVGQWLRTRARGFVFSTGVAPVLATQILQVLDDLCGSLGEQRREALWSNVRLLAHELGIPPDQQRSPIFPILVDPLDSADPPARDSHPRSTPDTESTEAARNNQRALMLSRALLARGFHVQAIRPPTVPAGTARLRVTVTALHTHDQLRAFARELKALRASI